ncbi:ATP-binding protein [Caulobacter sp. FWC2]|uniref:ATP-binding protein n=1 Tax=Caulobacter sp. FWC2 TaxID=69664 RepID=UPI000C14A962|nr:ATP-binding protein [Caulobacter sp. FWC2]PIB90503.1 hypothetical protein CSW62_02320 [Caulobacter sp. FWC2]
MPIVIDDIERVGRGVGPWTIPARRAFAKSSAYWVLRRSLNRYVARQTAGGRSFLIAGHRGAGKTALVEQVVNDMRWDAIESVAAGGVVDAPRRPFIVKLHGPSLIAPTWGSLPSKDSEDPQSVTEPAHRALIQITLALYRAFAQEIGSGFELHAQAVVPRTDHLEFAGQLQLELDQAPDPATIRYFWKRLSRLNAGVLWPDPPAGLDGLPADQGVREVVALATAAQAFRVCAGKPSQTEANSDAFEREIEAKTTGGLDFKGAANKLMGVVLGVGASALAQANQRSLTEIIGLGLATGLLSTLALNWTDTRRTTRKRARDYTFIRDFSVATLDRELPLAIDRIKSAGLVPVFVVDELDKIPQSAVKIAELLTQLKHIVTDFGFFCFLTDRDCFEAMGLAINASAYPVEHTVFSDRLLITYEPPELTEHLRNLTRWDDSAGSEEKEIDRRAQRILVLETVLRARPHFIDVTRRLARACDVNDQVRATSDDLNRPHCELAATFQLAIQLVFEDPVTRMRLEEDPGILQHLVDTLYWPVGAWEREEAEFEYDEDRLRTYLAARGGAGSTPPTAPTLSFLLDRLSALFDYLEDTTRISARLLSGADANKPWATVLPTFTSALVSRDA